MKIKRTITVRVDPDGWRTVRETFKGMSDPEISRRLAFPTNEDYFKKCEEKAKKTRDRWINGSVQDVFLILVLLIVLSVGLVLGGTMMSEFNDKIQSSSAFPQQSKDITTRGVSTFTNTWDDMILAFFIFASLATIILAALIRVSPLYIPIFFIFLMMLLISSGIVSNIYSGFSEQEATQEFSETLTYTPLIMQYLPMLTGFISVILAIVMYRNYKLNS